MIAFTGLENYSPKFSAVGIYIIYNKKILYLKYSNKYNGLWTIPAGKVNDNEKEINAVIRETYEEAGIRINNNQVQHLYSAYVSYPGGNDFLWFVYKCELEELPEVTLSKEHSEYIWITPSEALKLDLIEHEHECLRKAFNLK